MRKLKYSEYQIVQILKKADAGMSVNEVWRKYGISSATYPKWKANPLGFGSAMRGYVWRGKPGTLSVYCALTCQDAPSHACCNRLERLNRAANG
jgi:transposase